MREQVLLKLLFSGLAHNWNLLWRSNCCKHVWERKIVNIFLLWGWGGGVLYFPFYGGLDARCPSTMKECKVSCVEDIRLSRISNLNRAFLPREIPCQRPRRSSFHRTTRTLYAKKRRGPTPSRYRKQPKDSPWKRGVGGGVEEKVTINVTLVKKVKMGCRSGGSGVKWRARTILYPYI